MTKQLEGLAEVLFYAARRDDWGAANEDEREEFYDLARAAQSFIASETEKEK